MSLNSSSRAFTVYIALAAGIAAGLNGIAYWLGGEQAAAVTAILAVYVLTIFDVKFASTRWSMLRRILPRVSWFDCLIYGLPFAYLTFQALGANVDARRDAIIWIASLFGYAVLGLYFLVRWSFMRRGSADDLSWLFSPNLSTAERWDRYLGVQVAESKASKGPH